MKKIRFAIKAPLLCLVLSLLFLSGCYRVELPESLQPLPAITKEPSFPTPEQNLVQALELLRSGDTEELVDCIFTDEQSSDYLSDGFNLDVLEQYDIDATLLSEATKTITTKLYEGLEYEILSSKITGDNATVTVLLTTPDGELLVETFIDEFASLYAKSLFTGGSDPKQLAGEVIGSMIENIDDLSKQKKTTQTTIEMIKGDDRWLIVPNDELGDAITGGTISATEQLSRFAKTILPMTE